MKLEVNRRQLLAAVKRARKFQSSELAKGNLILECVELCADSGDLTVMSNGGFTWYRAPLAADLEQDGTVIASAKRLQKLLEGIRDTTVTLQARKSTRDDLSVHFGAGEAHLTLGLQDTGALPEWPVSPAESPEVLLSLPLPSLRRMLGKVAHAIGIGSKSLPAAARMSVTGGELHLEATDGHRAIHVKAAGFEGLSVAGIGIPSDAIARIVQLKHDCLVTLLEHEGKVLLHLATGERIAFVSPDIAPFPDLATFIAKRPETEISAHVSVNRELLLSAAQAASAINQTLVFSSEENETLNLTCQSEFSGDYAQEIAAEVGGRLKETGINPAYVIDALESIETSEVDIEFGIAEDSRIDFVPTLTARSNEYQRECVMPVRIEQATGEERAEAQPKKTRKGKGAS